MNKPKPDETLPTLAPDAPAQIEALAELEGDPRIVSVQEMREVMGEPEPTRVMAGAFELKLADVQIGDLVYERLPDQSLELRRVVGKGEHHVELKRLTDRQQEIVDKALTRPMRPRPPANRAEIRAMHARNRKRGTKARQLLRGVGLSGRIHRPLEPEAK